MPRQKKNTSKGKDPTRLNRRQAPQETVEIADFGAMSNKALRLLLGQHQLRQTSRLENILIHTYIHTYIVYLITQVTDYARIES